VLNRVNHEGWRGSAPAQMNIPARYVDEVHRCSSCRRCVPLRTPLKGRREAIAQAAELLCEGKVPGDPCRAPGVVLSGAIRDLAKLAERLDAPVEVCSNLPAQ